MKKSIIPSQKRMVFLEMKLMKVIQKLSILTLKVDHILEEVFISLCKTYFLIHKLKVFW